MAQMTHRERVTEALAGRPTDRPPISLWRHFGGIDVSPDGLTEAMVEFQDTYDFDFVKFMPSGTYPIMDWGAETSWEPHARGTRTVHRLPVNRIADWATLKPLDVEKGMFGVVNDALRQTVRAIGPDTHVLQTIFSPLTIANKLGGPVTLAALRQEPALFEQAMAVLADLTERLVAAALDSGADIFYATQTCTAEVLGLEEVRRWETPYAERLLGPLRGRALVLLHAHGDYLWFDEVAGWPISGLNWHDRRGGPPLSEGLQRTGAGLVGGLNGYASLRNGPRQAVLDEVADAIAQAGGRLVVGPGCVIPGDCPPHLIRAARAAVEGVAAPAS
jgi:uroporphyrinogen decarboxylase